MNKHILEKKFVFIYIFSVFLILVGTACQTREYKDFTTYFNTFYNAERLMKESEEEFNFQKEKKRVNPKVIAPITHIPALDINENLYPLFLSDIVISKAARQAVEVKLDSILIKGSKIISKNPKGKYIEPTLYLMAKTYFYKEEWLPSQIKCSELIDLAPDGDLSPDAHLLMCFNLILQKKYLAGKTMLSRTIDVAWFKKRYDILTKAFNMEAELSLLDNDLEGAVRPYFQAIAQSDNKEAQAIWQCELGNILFRMGRFERAKNAYLKVMNFSPDLVTEYESKIYLSSCLIRLGDPHVAEKILKRLEDDGKFTEWKDYVVAQNLLATRLSASPDSLIIYEQQADKLFPTSQAKAAYYFEKGIEAYKKNDYIEARRCLAIGRGTPSYISNTANKLFNFLNNYEVAHKSIEHSKNDLLNPKLSKTATNNSINLDSATTKINSETTNNTTTTSNNINTDSTSATTADSSVTINNNTITTTTNNNNNNLKHEEDNKKVELANNYFSLARLHNNIGNVDSANYYYKEAAMAAPLNREQSARYLYTYSVSIRDTNQWLADSILDVIVLTQPRTEHGRAAMSQLGYTSAFIMDTVAGLYNSGYDLMKHSEYNYAIKQFSEVYTLFSHNHIYAPKALYSIGYIYETKYQKYDSACYYYKKIINEYPNSAYAKELELPTLYLTILQSDGEIPDSLKTKDVEIYHANYDVLTAPIDSSILLKPPVDDGKFKFDDLKNPSKLLEKTQKKLRKTFDENTDYEKIKQQMLDKINPNELTPKLEDFVPKEIKELLPNDTTNQRPNNPPK